MAIPLPPDRPDDADPSAGGGRPREAGGGRGPRPDPLTTREKQLLEGIEGDLAAADPELVVRMRRAPSAWTRAWPGGSPVSGRSVVLLVVGLVVVVLAASLIPGAGWVVLALLTTLVVVPWLVLAAPEPPRSNRSPGPRPGSGPARN